MILYFGTRMELKTIPEGSVLAEIHSFAQRQAIGCCAKGEPKVFFMEVEPDEVRFVEDIGYLRYNKEPVGWHRVGR